MRDRGDDAGVSAWVERVRAWSGRRLRSGLGAGWVVAVSGGSDSVGLLRALHRVGPGLGLRLSVAHLDHGVRGEAAEADARFVADLAGSLGLPFDLGRWRPERPGHFEADARRARYAWLAEVAHARDASAVAVGHTRDDQAETILHRILRGTGPRGLAGMPARRPLDDTVTLVRPLLAASRSEVRAWLGAIGQPYRDDPTNLDTARTRARIRHDLLPVLAGAYNPAVVEAIVRLGRLAGSAQHALDRYAAELARSATLDAGPDAIAFDREALARLPLAERAEILRLAWRRSGWPEAGMTADRWRRLARLARSGRGLASIGAGIDLECSREVVRLARASTVSGPGPERPGVALAVPGSAAWGGGRVVASLDPDDRADEAIDLDQVEPPLSVGPPRPGERFEPLGLEGRGQPLREFLRARRVPRADRPSTPIVRDASGIVWVVGHRIAHRVRRTGATARILGLRWEPADPLGPSA